MSNIFQKPPNNYQYIIGLSNLVNNRLDSVNQVAPVTNGILHDNIVVPANTLAQDGQILTIHASGSIGIHGASSVTMIVQENGGTMFSATIPADGNARGWEIIIRIIRLSSSGVTRIGYLFAGLGVGGTAAVLQVHGATFGQPFVPTIDNTYRFLCTDAVGAETIIQNTTWVGVH